MINQDALDAAVRRYLSDILAEYQRSMECGPRRKGRPVTINRDEVARLKDEGMRPVEIAEKLGVARSSVYRVMEA